MQHVETVLIEVLMDGVLQPMAQAEHRIEGARAEPQMGLFAQELHRMPLHLDRIDFRVRVAKNLEGLDFKLRGLPLALTFDQGACGRNGRSCGQSLSQRLIGIVAVNDQLQVGQAGAVIDGKELVIPEGPDPSTYGDLLSCEGGVEQLGNRVALHFGVF